MIFSSWTLLNKRVLKWKAALTAATRLTFINRNHLPTKMAISVWLLSASSQSKASMDGLLPLISS